MYLSFYICKYKSDEKQYPKTCLETTGNYGLTI